MAGNTHTHTHTHTIFQSSHVYQQKNLNIVITPACIWDNYQYLKHALSDHYNFDYQSNQNTLDANISICAQLMLKCAHVQINTPIKIRKQFYNTENKPTKGTHKTNHKHNTLYLK